MNFNKFDKLTEKVSIILGFYLLNKIIENRDLETSDASSPNLLFKLQPSLIIYRYLLDLDNKKFS